MKKSHSYSHQKDQLLQRLRRIEGQVRGIQKMIEGDRYCVDVLVQLAAIKAAVHQTGLQVMESHTRGCVTGAIQSGDGEKAIGELMDVIRQFVK